MCVWGGGGMLRGCVRGRPFFPQAGRRFVAKKKEKIRCRFQGEEGLPRFQ